MTALAAGRGHGCGDACGSSHCDACPWALALPWAWAWAWTCAWGRAAWCPKGPGLPVQEPQTMLSGRSRLRSGSRACALAQTASTEASLRLRTGGQRCRLAGVQTMALVPGLGHDKGQLSDLPWRFITMLTTDTTSATWMV